MQVPRLRISAIAMALGPIDPFTPQKRESVLIRTTHHQAITCKRPTGVSNLHIHIFHGVQICICIPNLEARARQKSCGGIDSAVKHFATVFAVKVHNVVLSFSYVLRDTVCFCRVARIVAVLVLIR